MAPTDVVHGLLEHEDRRMSEVASTFAHGLPVVFKLGENHFSCVLATRVNLIIGTFMQLFCMAMAWSSGHTGLRPVVMYVCEWMEAVPTSWHEGTFMFISRNGRTEVAVYRKCHFAVDMKGLFLFLLRSTAPSAEWTSGLLAGATFDYKNWLFWAHLQWDRQNSTAKMFCL